MSGWTSKSANVTSAGSVEVMGRLSIGAARGAGARAAAGAVSGPIGGLPREGSGRSRTRGRIPDPIRPPSRRGRRGVDAPSPARRPPTRALPHARPVTYCPCSLRPVGGAAGTRRRSARGPGVGPTDGSPRDADEARRARVWLGAMALETLDDAAARDRLVGVPDRSWRKLLAKALPRVDRARDALRRGPVPGR